MEASEDLGKRLAATERDYRIIPPKEQWTSGYNHSFPPGEFGGDGPFVTTRFTLSKPGNYRIKLTYTNGQEAKNKFAQGSWTGNVTSNELVLKVLPAGGQKEVNGLKLTLSADKTETVMKADGSDADPVELNLTFTNVSDKPIKFVHHFWVMRFNVTPADPKDIEITGGGIYRPFGGSIDEPVLQPGQSWSWPKMEMKMLFPGSLEAGKASRAEFRVRKPGSFRIQCSYGGDKNDVADAWTGTLDSNEVTITVKPAD